MLAMAGGDADKCSKQLQTEEECDTAGVIPEILSLLEANKHYNDIRKHLTELNVSQNESLEQEKAGRWMTWAKRNRLLKLVHAAVPFIVMPRYGAEICDIKVFSKGRPDDAIYDGNKDIRDKVARGNSFLTISKGPHAGTTCIIFALKKFTGGLGDDDDRDKGDDFTWKQYFTKSIDSTERIVCTQKVNGEAGHLSCLQLDGEFFICGGSKNVHMIIRKKEDIDLYTDSRFQIAREVCHAVMDALERLDDATRNRLLRFLCITKLTAIFEILIPDHQHVEDLSYLKEPELKFITWTSTDLEPSDCTQLSPLPPHVGIEIARVLGLNPTKYDIIPYSEVHNRMKQIRQGYNYEGEVLYFLDGSGSVIGMLKKKTVWYIICRAIREKARAACHSYMKSSSSFSISLPIRKTNKRIYEIKNWLGFDEKTLEEWKRLAEGFLKWLSRKMNSGTLSVVDIATLFPVTWNKFLSEMDETDKVRSCCSDVGDDAGEVNGACAAEATSDSS